MNSFLFLKLQDEIRRYIDEYSRSTHAHGACDESMKT